jgi:hypothetical protein
MHQNSARAILPSRDAQPWLPDAINLLHSRIGANKRKRAALIAAAAILAAGRGGVYDFCPASAAKRREAGIGA